MNMGAQASGILALQWDGTTDAGATDAGTAYVLFSFAARPKILRTTDGGANWQDISTLSTSGINWMDIETLSKSLISDTTSERFSGWIWKRPRPE